MAYGQEEIKAWNAQHVIGTPGKSATELPKSHQSLGTENAGQEPEGITVCSTR